MSGNLELPVVDLRSSDRASTVKSIREACLEYGFFYLVNHGIDEETLVRVFEGSKKFFSLPLSEKMKLGRDEEHRGYTAPFAEKLDTSLGRSEVGDLKESFYIGPMDGRNKWPSEEISLLWRETMVSYYEKAWGVGKSLMSLIALSLDLDELFFEKVGALQTPSAFLRLLHYPGHLAASDNANYGASAHSDYGMVTLLASDGVPGLQICREKDKHPRVWEDVRHLDGALVVNIGDLLERWTNCLFRSTLHRVLAVGQERYSIAFFMDPKSDCLVECLDSCCSETCPPRFPPIRGSDYLRERLRVTYT